MCAKLRARDAKKMRDRRKKAKVRRDCEFFGGDIGEEGSGVYWSWGRNKRKSLRIVLSCFQSRYR